MNKLYVALIITFMMPLCAMEQESVEIDYQNDQKHHFSKLILRTVCRMANIPVRPIHDTSSQKKDSSNQELSLKEQCELLMLLRIPEAKIPFDQLYQLDLSGQGNWGSHSVTRYITLILEIQNVKTSPKKAQRVLQNQTLKNSVKLCTLLLSNNCFTELPDTISQLTDLTELNVSNNKLTTIHDAIGCLTNLKKLNLANNRPLQTLPLSMTKLRALEELDIRDNRDLEVPAEISSMSKLYIMHI